MPPSEEKVAKIDFDVGDLPTNDSNESELHQEEKKPDMESSEFALKMINSVKAMNNGELIIISVPALTEERRRELVKQVKLETENCKISIRNARKKANEEVKKLSKDGLSEDISRDAESSVQNLTDKFISITDKHFTDKEKDVMTI